MAKVTDILEEIFLEKIQSGLVKLIGNMSIVFEDIDGEPIGGTREFAPDVSETKGSNLCKMMIDADRNPTGKATCKASDFHASHQASRELKPFLYNCHEGCGFPNIAIPIKVWEKIVIGNLYAGQFLFKPMSDIERASFVGELERRDYSIENVHTFTRSWTSQNIHDFYRKVVSAELRNELPYSRFKELFENQLKNGISSDKFLSAVEHLESLANYMSEMGNAVFTLREFMKIESEAPPYLKIKLSSDIETLRNLIYSVLVKRTCQKEAYYSEAIANIQRLSERLLREIRKYDAAYTEALLKPYSAGMLPMRGVVEEKVVEFYILRTYYEILKFHIALSLNPSIETTDFCQEGTDSTMRFLGLLSKYTAVGHQLKYDISVMMVELQRRLAYLIDEESMLNWLCALHQYERGSIEGILNDLGIYMQFSDKVEEILHNKERVLLPKPFETLSEEIRKLSGDLHSINSRVFEAVPHAKTDLNIEDIVYQIERMKQIQHYIIDSVYFQDCAQYAMEQRKKFDLRYDTFFLNAGGLTPIHPDVLRAMNDWRICRESESPIGGRFEKKLKTGVEDARKRVAAMLHCEPRNIVFSGGTTDGIKLVIEGLNMGPGDEIVISDAEHNTVHYLCDYYYRNRSVKITRLDLVGKDVNEWHKLFCNKIKMGRKRVLVILSHITYNTGDVVPVKRIAGKCRKTFQESRNTDSGNKLFILIDGAQSVGNIEVEVEKLECDFYAFDGHKWLFGPEEIGALYIRDNIFDDESIELCIPYAFTPHRILHERAQQLSGRDAHYELATIDATKIIGLGKAAGIFGENCKQIFVYKKDLTKGIGTLFSMNKNIELVNQSSYKQSNMLIMQCKDLTTYEEYDDLARQLREFGIVVRSLAPKPSLRLCASQINILKDFEIFSNSTNFFLGESNGYYGSYEDMKEALESRITKSFDGEGVIHNKGIILFGPPGTGKTYFVDELAESMLKNKTIRTYRKIGANEIKGNPNPIEKLDSVLKVARKRAPSVVLFDEIDSILTKSGGGDSINVVGCFIQEYNEIAQNNEKVFFIGTTNDIDKVAPAILNRRMTASLFPLPSFKSRCKIISNLLSKSTCSDELRVDAIAGVTKGYTVDEIIKLRGMADDLSKGKPIQPSHFHKSLDALPRRYSSAMLEEYLSKSRSLGYVDLTRNPRLKKRSESKTKVKIGGLDTSPSR